MAGQKAPPQMIGADSNIILRYLLDDDEPQVGRVHALLARTRRADERVYVSCIVVCEVVWAMQSIYSKSRPQIIAALGEIMNSDVFELEEFACVSTSMEQFKNGKGDFAD